MYLVISPHQHVPTWPLRFLVGQFTGERTWNLHHFFIKFFTHGTPSTVPLPPSSPLSHARPPSFRSPRRCSAMSISSFLLLLPCLLTSNLRENHPLCQPFPNSSHVRFVYVKQFSLFPSSSASSWPLSPFPFGAKVPVDMTSIKYPTILSRRVLCSLLKGFAFFSSQLFDACSWLFILLNLRERQLQLQITISCAMFWKMALASCSIPSLLPVLSFEKTVIFVCRFVLIEHVCPLRCGALNRRSTRSISVLRGSPRTSAVGSQ